MTKDDYVFERIEVEEGGLGIRPLSQLNEAFLSKLAWKIVSNPSSLLARVFDAKYNRGRG